MNIQLLQWGLLSFMLGLFLSLPLAAVHDQNGPQWTKLFTNPRKLKSAHLDFFTQAFAAAFAYLLESALRTQFPAYVAIPLLFGTICNPLLLLMEATPLYRAGFGAVVYQSLRATSPLALLFAWFSIAWNVLPAALWGGLAAFVFVGVALIVIYRRRKGER